MNFVESKGKRIKRRDRNFFKEPSVSEQKFVRTTYSRLIQHHNKRGKRLEEKRIEKIQKEVRVRYSYSKSPRAITTAFIKRMAIDSQKRSPRVNIEENQSYASVEIESVEDEPISKMPEREEQLPTKKSKSIRYSPPSKSKIFNNNEPRVLHHSPERLDLLEEEHQIHRSPECSDLMHLDGDEAELSPPLNTPKNERVALLKVNDSAIKFQDDTPKEYSEEKLTPPSKRNENAIRVRELLGIRLSQCVKK